MKITKNILVASVAVLFSTSAFAATTASLKNAPNGGQITLSGTVEDFDNAHTFTLHDTNGTVKVDLGATKSVVLKNGETVSVTGTVDNGLLGTKLVATTVSENKAVGEQIGEAIDSVTGQDAAGSAQAVSVKTLPKSGLVKINGTVDSVSSEKEFTLKDATGQVDVNIKSGKSASLNKGAQVKVVGYVNNGLLSKKINATDVEVLSNGAQGTKD